MDNSDVGIKYAPFIMWLNSNNGGKDMAHIPETKVRELCKLLGIEIREIDKNNIQIIIHPFPEKTLKIATNENHVRYYEEKRLRAKIKNDKFFED